MISFEFFQHVGIGAPARFGAPGFFAIEPKCFEQQFSQLFGGGQIEVHPCGLLGLLLKFLEGVAKFNREFL